MGGREAFRTPGSRARAVNGSTSSQGVNWRIATRWPRNRVLAIRSSGASLRVWVSSPVSRCVERLPPERPTDSVHRRGNAGRARARQPVELPLSARSHLGGWASCSGHHQRRQRHGPGRQQLGIFSQASGLTRGGLPGGGGSMFRTGAVSHDSVLGPELSHQMVPSGINVAEGRSGVNQALASQHRGCGASDYGN